MHAVSKVKLNLKAKADHELVTFTRQHITKMTGNAAFPTPDPPAAVLLTLVDDFETAVTESNSAQVVAKERTSIKETARHLLETGLSTRASYVDSKSNGVEAVILSSGLPVRNQPAPIGPLAQAANLSITAGDSEGRVDLHWDPVRGNKGYEIQMSTDPNVLTSWQLIDTSSASRLSLMGLTSGQKVWFRVRARAPKKANDGAWSDPATKVVP